MDSLNQWIAELEADLGVPPEAPSAAPAAAAAAAPAPAAAAAEAAAQPAEHDGAISKLDLRVGLIVRAWKHETADKLYCEEIDVGEETPRQIASGLVPYYSEAEMQNRRVLVMANLKAKKLVGFKSHGMVLCAASADGSTVEFVEPPEGAAVGERVAFPGCDGEPISAAQMDKRKVVQALLPGLRTDADRVATWNGVPFMTSAGPCTAPTLANAEMR